MVDELTWGGAGAVPSAAELAEYRAAAAAALRPTDSGFCAAHSTAYRDMLQGGASPGTRLAELAAEQLPLDAGTGAFGSDPGPVSAGAGRLTDMEVAGRAAAAAQQVFIASSLWHHLCTCASLLSEHGPTAQSLQCFRLHTRLCRRRAFLMHCSSRCCAPSLLLTAVWCVCRRHRAATFRCQTGSLLLTQSAWTQSGKSTAPAALTPPSRHWTRLGGAMRLSPAHLQHRMVAHLVNSNSLGEDMLT